MPKRETVILHDFGGGIRTGITERFTKRGKGGKFTIDVEATPLVHTFDDRALAAEGAEALVSAIKKDMAGQGNASSDTVDKRRHHRALWMGTTPKGRGPYKTKNNSSGTSRPPWLQKMYSGGRIGETPPVVGPDRWRGSGRLARSVVARWVEPASAYVVNVAANRLNHRELAERFANDMPTLSDLRSFVRTPEFRSVVERNFDMLIAKAAKAGDARRVALLKQQYAVARGILELGRAVGGV